MRTANEMYVELMDKIKKPISSTRSYYAMGENGEIFIYETYDDAIRESNKYFGEGKYIIVKIIEDKYILLYGE